MVMLHQLEQLSRHNHIQQSPECLFDTNWRAVSLFRVKRTSGGRAGMSGFDPFCDMGSSGILLRNLIDRPFRESQISAVIPL
jgi:hypothetical protein